MPSRSEVRVYIACSLDGFIAGVDDDISWLHGDGAADEKADDTEGQEQTNGGALGFEEFIAGVGALLMGRRTYDVVTGLADELPYGDVPLLVATTRSIDNAGPTVRPVRGTISEIIEEAREVAAGKDVYLDGGNLIRQALDAGQVDDLIITVVPIVLGEGISLFGGVTQRHSLKFTGHYFYGGMVQLHARPAATT